MKPCIHGLVCREYLQRFGKILSRQCPDNCKHYEPKEDYEEIGFYKVMKKPER